MTHLRQKDQPYQLDNSKSIIELDRSNLDVLERPFLSDNKFEICTSENISIHSDSKKINLLWLHLYVLCYCEFEFLHFVCCSFLIDILEYTLKLKLLDFRFVHSKIETYYVLLLRPQSNVFETKLMV